jgi:hypothetical protein
MQGLTRHQYPASASPRPEMSLALVHRSTRSSNRASWSWQLADGCVPVTVTLRPTGGTVASLAAGGHWPMPSLCVSAWREREREVWAFVNGRRSRAVSVQSGVLSLTTLSETPSAVCVPCLCKCRWLAIFCGNPPISSAAMKNSNKEQWERLRDRSGLGGWVAEAMMS